MTIDLTKHGFQRCEFDDGDCEACKKQDQITWFRSENYWDCREGSYWCTACAEAEVALHLADEEEPFPAALRARMWLDGIVTLEEAMRL